LISMKPLHVMFLCWGYSIHAKRRVQIFIDDPRFEVTVVSTFDYEFVGARNVLLRAAETSTKISKTREKMSFLIPAFVRGLLRKFINLFGIGLELKKMKRDLNALRETVNRVKPDVVFLQTLQYPSFLALLLPKHLRMAITFWNGDLTYFAKWTGIEMIAKKQIVKHGLRRADVITVNSQTAHDAAVKIGASSGKITLVRYPGADLNRFYPRPKDIARKRLAISARHVVLCPRGLGTFFNSDVIVEAAAQVARTHSDVLFLFVSGVGGQEEWDRHLRLSSAFRIMDKLRWDGHIPWEEMPWYYCVADVMVSIKTADSCPNCMLEAMACATPVVMSDTQQNREWIENGVNGFLCPPRNPGIVAQMISKTFDNEGDFVSEFTRNCLEKIRRDANSTINIDRIKALIINLVDSAGNGSNQC
jgi:glycosyltransferase involved in cell wall biosynthesis